MSRIPRLGDRVRITGRMQDPNPIPVGATGTVYWLGNWKNTYNQRIGVRWDSGRDLSLLAGDPFRVLG